MATSLKKNYIYNLLQTLTALLFPIVSFPYVTRIFGADGIGQVQFFNSIVQYICLLTALGIPLYAVREIARVRDDSTAAARTSAEILTLQLGLTFLGYVLVAILALTVPQIRQDVPLFLVLSIAIFFNAIGVEWYFTAIEDFAYIATRAVLVRVLLLVALFTLVHTKDDLLIYAAVLVASTVGNNLLNIVRYRHKVRHQPVHWREMRVMRHLRPALHIFVLNLIISIYINLDTVMLGFLGTTTAVGYYTAATKLTRMTQAVATSMGTVLLPRLSNLLTNGRRDEFDALGAKAMSYMIALTAPMVVGMIVTAQPLIAAFCGSGFDPSVMTLQIIAPVVLIIGMSNIMGIQILYPQNLENTVIACTAIGATVNFTLNMLLIPRYAQFGAGAATVVAELCVTTSMLWLGRRHLPRILTWHNAAYVGGALLMGAVVAPVRLLPWGALPQLALMVAVGIATYAAFLILKRDALLKSALSLLKK